MEEAYFEWLYRTYYPVVFRYAIGKVRNEEFAEDVVQETFMEAFKGIEKIKNCNSVAGWLITIAKRVLYHQYQIPENQGIMVPLDEIVDQLQVSDVYPEENFRESVSEVLHKEDTDLIVFLYEEGYSVEEAASHFGISLSACKMRLLRARGKIRMSYLAKEAGHGEYARKESAAEG